MVEIDLLEMPFAKHPGTELCKHVATVKRGNTDLGQLGVIMNLVLRVKANHDHVIGQRGDIGHSDHSETVL